MTKHTNLILLVIASLLFQSCAAPAASPVQSASPTPAAAATIAAPTITPTPSITPTITATPAPTMAPMTDFMSGMTFDTGFGFKNGFASQTSDEVLTWVIKPMGVNWIALMAQCSLSSVNSPQVICDEASGTPSDGSLRHVIQTAKSLGLRVLLKPNLVIPSGGFALDVKMQNKADWLTFFASYTAAMVHFATLASETQVDYFSVGTEMNNTQQRSDDWRKLIQEVRAVYAGPLTYSANHSGGETGVQWWDALDAIGVDAYYPLTNLNNPTVDQLKAAWAPHVTVLEALSKKWDRPIIFTEAGYTSEDGTNRTPWAGLVDKPLDLQEQTDCYQALIETFRDKPWWKGVFWFHQSIMPAEGGPAGQFWEIDGKPAENVLRAFNSQPPFPTATPIPTYDTTPNQGVEIFSDQLGNHWELPSVFTWADLNSTEQVFAGEKAIKVQLEPWASIQLWVDPAVDTSTYDAVEFYIYIARVKNAFYPNINVYFNDANGDMMMAIPDIMRPGYVEDGDLTLGKWHRVRIPLAELGAVNQRIRTLVFANHSDSGIVNFYLDNISLVKYAR